ncbi:MAG: PQQ-binding-like beta-propeller repeat protein [Verrucomicrobiota bacterium]|nr:PQQ-binding-like beta-propeller repeat protein [Verrucomicrobiota bacterium]
MNRIIPSFLLMTGLVAQAAEGPAFHWLFEPDRVKGKEVQALAGGKPAKFSGTARVETESGPAHLFMNGSGHRAWVADELTGLKLPKKEITVSAWVKVDKPARWGGICGVIQDNGSYERGWILGYENARFNFALNSLSNDRLTYLTDKTDYRKGYWHHVAGVYDGTEMRLYVNGRLRVNSAAQKGVIRYPPQALFEIGAYHDDDEFYRLAGGIHEVAVWSRALSAKEIEVLFKAKEKQFPMPPQPLEITHGPFVDWVDRGTVRLEWETSAPMRAKVVFRSQGGHRLETSPGKPATRHVVTLNNLLPDAEYTYRITSQGADGREYESRKPYLFDSSFYYRLPDKSNAPSPFPDSNLSSVIQAAAKRIVAQSGINKGYCLMLGSAEGRLAYELARQTQLQVIVVEPDAGRAQAIRQKLNKAGLYGVRVSVHHGALDELPYGPYFANLVVSGSMLMDGKLPGPDAAELWRVLRPAGGVAMLGHVGNGLKPEALRQWFGRAGVKCVVRSDVEGVWATVKRGKLEGAGDWTHQYGSSDNTANSRDDLVRGEMGILWWGEPGPKPFPDRGGRNPAPLAANGRLFVQADRMIYGMDAYNGSILWTLSAPGIRRSNMPRDGSNMVASKDYLYLAGGRHALGIDAQTGERKLRFSAPKDRHWAFMAVTGNQLLGSSVKPGSAYVADAGEWYDSTKAPEIARMASDSLFSFDRRTGKQLWKHTGGLVMNSTITIADGVVYFVESRNDEPAKLATSRVAPGSLSKQHLVALDQVTGRKLWEKPVDFSKCEIMLYLLHSEGTLVATGTDSKKTYHTYAYDVSSPSLRFAEKPNLNPDVPKLWEDHHTAAKDHHGGLIQHPLVVKEVFYSDNRAFALRTGKVVRTDLPQRRGCGTMAASNHSMFYRAHFHGMWDLEAKPKEAKIEFNGIRSGCWLGIIPAQGLMLAPGNGSACGCTHAIQTSAAWVPRSALKKPKK